MSQEKMNIISDVHVVESPELTQHPAKLNNFHTIAPASIHHEISGL